MQRRRKCGSCSESCSRTTESACARGRWPWRVSSGVIAMSALTMAGACSRETAPSGSTAATSSSAVAAKVGLGTVMVEVAHRFETAGRAANANRFALADFEIGELEELFETDVPGAELPKEGPTAHIPAMAKAFLDGNVPELKKAAAAGDRTAFAAAFQHAASVCNACHQAAAKGFIVVPSEPGKAVPDLDPLPAPSATSHP
jgi:hypothetical protein